MLGDAAFPDIRKLRKMPEGKDCVMMCLCFDVHYETHMSHCYS